MPEGGKTSRQKWWGLTFGICRPFGSQRDYLSQREMTKTEMVIGAQVSTSLPRRAPDIMGSKSPPPRCHALVPTQECRPWPKRLKR